MAPSHLLILFLFTTLFNIPSTQSQSQSQSQSNTCTSQTFTNNRLYSLCTNLPSLSSSLHWTYNPSRSTLSIAFLASPAQPNGWISWAINPSGTGMQGSQALIAFRDGPNNGMVVKTYNITSYGPVRESSILYQVRDSSAEFENGVMRIFATLVLPNGMTEFNHVWQVGGSVTGGVPDRHEFQPGNLNARGRLNLLRGQNTGVVVTADSRTHNRNVHGILNVVSLGVLFPVGIIIARYLRTFPSADPAWFYLHAFCQVSAYAIGVAGWGTGLRLGSQSEGVVYPVHRNIGITLFSIATVQIFALFLRPSKDHKYRFYWNIYHHSLGYTIVVLGIINVFRGFSILNPEQKWRHAYVIVIAVLGGIALLLEAITWIYVLRKKKSGNATKPLDGSNNGHGRP